ncbi:MAG: hypothetical protein WB820_18230 [Rhodoplanes sp.]
MRVEVETDEALGLSMPRKFRFDWRAIEVVEIIDQWFGADHRYCKLKGGDGALYILRLDESRYEWSLIMFASQEAQAIATHSSAGVHPYPARQRN